MSDSGPPGAAPGYGRCRKHPEAATRLRCGSCEDFICPACTVQGPVGMRCPDCGKSPLSPVYDVSGPYLVRAAAAAAAVGAACGFVYGLLFSGLAWGALLMLGIGYLVAEAASAAANRRRGRTMQYVVGGGIVLALAVALMFGRAFTPWTLIGAVAAVFLGIGRVR